jgi:hypothetical protein
MEKRELDLVTSNCTMSCNALLHDCTRHVNAKKHVKLNAQKYAKVNAQKHAKVNAQLKGAKSNA